MMQQAALPESKPQRKSGRIEFLLLRLVVLVVLSVLGWGAILFSLQIILDKPLGMNIITSTLLNNAAADDKGNLISPMIPEAVLTPAQIPNYTLGFLQTLCKGDAYPLTESCFYYPTDLWPDTPEYAPFKDGGRLLHYQDFLNDEFNGVSWCPNITGFNNITGFDPGFKFQKPCLWHHHIALSSFAQCMLKKVNITYFLDTGGLIGSLRNGGFELTDYDIDFAAWIPDEKSIGLLARLPGETSALVENSNNVPPHVTIQVNLNARLHVNFFSGIHGRTAGHVDVWRFNVTEGNHSNVRSTIYNEGSGIDKENLFPLGQCNYIGKVVPCPHLPYSFLKQWYFLKNDDLFVSPKTDMYTPEASLASSNRSMNCLEAGGFPTLRKDRKTKPYFADDDPLGHPYLSD